MSADEQRIAIAEWCGWKQINETGIWHHDATCRNAIPKDGKIYNKRREMRMPSDHYLLPDYLNDLNAMHEAEGKLQDDSVQAYEAHLNAAISKDCRVCDFSLYASDKIWNATAKHRAEALLRTIGRWTDSTLHTKG